MTDGELPAMLGDLAGQMAGSMADAGGKVADLAGNAAGIEESNLGAIADIDAEIARMADGIRMGPTADLGLSSGKPGLASRVGGIFRKSAPGEIGEGELYVWGSGGEAGGYRAVTDADRQKIYENIRVNGYVPPPPDPAGQLAGYVTVYKFLGVGDDDALLPKKPADEIHMGRWTVLDRKAGAMRSNYHESSDDSPFVPVTRDKVDPDHPPGKGRTAALRIVTFRVPSELLFDAPRTGYGQLFREDGERYFLGGNLEDYKVSESANPFAAGPNHPYSAWWSDNPYDA
jgi:hypothetical protein